MSLYTLYGEPGGPYGQAEEDMAELIVELLIPLRLLMLFRPAADIPGTLECPCIPEAIVIEEMELGAENIDWDVRGLIELKNVKFFVERGAGVSPLFVQLL